MTSWTHMIHIFAFVFLGAIDLSEEGCHDYLDMDKWENVTQTFSLVTTEDPKDTVYCMLEAACLQKGELWCFLMESCLGQTLPQTLPQTPSQQCKGNRSQVNIYHFMCLVAKASNHTLEGCEYELQCTTYSETPSTPSGLTTTPTTTTPTTTTPTTTTPTTPPTTTPPTTTPSTTTPSTTTPSTTTPSTTTPATTTLPETTTTTVLPSPTTAAIATLKPTAKKLAQVRNNETETLRLRESLKETQKETYELKTLLGLSLVLHAILPLAVYLYMRHRWIRDRMRDGMRDGMPSNSTLMSNGNLTGDLPKKESDAPPATLARDAENTRLIKRDKHSDDVILNCINGEDQTPL